MGRVTEQAQFDGSFAPAVVDLSLVSGRALAAQIAADPEMLAKVVQTQEFVRSWIRRRRFFSLVSAATMSGDRDLSGARKRAAVAREITETERSFLQQMQMLLNYYFVPFS